MKRDFKFFAKLFWSMLQLSAFTFGGGYVIVSLMRKKFVDTLGWLSEEEMLDFTAIAKSSPGAIAVNASILVGFKLAGVLGALTTIIATVIPPLVFLSVIAFFYSAFIENTIIQNVLLGMRAGVAAIIVDVVLGMVIAAVRGKHAWLSAAIMLVSFAAVFFFDVNVLFIIPVCIIIGILLFSSRPTERPAGQADSPTDNGEEED